MRQKTLSSFAASVWPKRGKKSILLYMKEKCIIITSHIHGNLKDLIDFDDAYILCADGGWELARDAGIKPDLIVGDLDSSKETPPHDIPLEKLPTHKDLTDTARCIHCAVEKGYRRIFLLGGLGGRADHSLANLQNMVAAAKKQISIIMMDAQNIVMALVDDEILLPAMPGYKLSLFSHSDRCEGVTARGVEYPLDNAVLTSDYPLGVSNEFVEEEAYLKVAHGTLLIMLSKD